MLWFICRQEVRHSGDPTGCMFGATSEDWQQWPLYKKWITSFYWSVLTVSSIGYGDYMPVSPNAHYSPANKFSTSSMSLVSIRPGVCKLP